MFKNEPNTYLPFYINSSFYKGGGNRVSPIYKLININGDGELIRLTKLAIKTKNFTQLDHLIRKEVVKYLYNEGRCENVKESHLEFISLCFI